MADEREPPPLFEEDDSAVEKDTKEEKTVEADQEVDLNDDDKDDLFSDPPLLETSPAEEKPAASSTPLDESEPKDTGGGVMDEVTEEPPKKEEKKEEPKLDEAEEEELESSDTYDVEITVSDPQKVGDGMGAFMRYTVSTKTSDPSFKSSDMSVTRRFSDFLGLHQKLVANHTTKGHIVPPVPEKSVVGMTKVKMGKGQQEEHNNSLEFAEKRRAALERFLNRSAAHPKIRANKDFKEFLEKDELPKASSTAALSGAGMMRAFNKVMDSASKVVSKMDESDQWFEEKTQHIENLDQQLKKLHTSVENMVNHRRELSNATAVFAKSCAMLGNAEEHTALSRAISQLAETEENIEQLHSSQAATDFYVLSELLKDYIGLIAAVREAFREREKAYHNWQNAQTNLAKKREQEAKLKTTGKTEKLPQVQQEITDWEERVEKGQREFEAISKTIRREVNRFEKTRVTDFRSVIIKYLESLMEKQQKLIQHWEAFLPEAKAIA